MNKLEVTEKMIQAEFSTIFFKLDHRNVEIWEELSFIKFNICSTSKFFTKFSTIIGSQSQSIHDSLYISKTLFAQSASHVNKDTLLLATSGIIKKIINAKTKSKDIKIIIIQNKSFIFHLLNLFRRGEKSTLKNRDNISINMIFTIL